MAQLVSDSNLREAGRLIRRGREAVRRFVSGDIETPHERTREAIARLYLKNHDAVSLAAAEVPQPAGSGTPLKLILPQGVERATTEIRLIFDALRRNSSELPASTSAVETWLLRRVKEEYATEVPYARPRKRRPKDKPEESEDEE